MSGTDRAHELGAFLAGIPFFASFDEGTLVWLARQFEPVHAQAGDAIIAEGDPGDGLYVLLSGRLQGQCRRGRRRSACCMTSAAARSSGRSRC